MSRIAVVSVCVFWLGVWVVILAAATNPAESADVGAPVEEAADVGKPVCSKRYYDLLQACLRGGQSPHRCEDYLQWHFGANCVASW